MEQNPDGVSDTAARAARDLTVVFNRLRRRLRSVAEDEDLTPPQVSALTLVGKHGAATASASALRRGSLAPAVDGDHVRRARPGALIHRNPTPRMAADKLIYAHPAGRRTHPGRPVARHSGLARTLEDAVRRGGTADPLSDALTLPDGSPKLR